MWIQSWKARFLIGAVLGGLIVFLWIRREAYIAGTPRVSESGISESVNQGQDAERVTAPTPRTDVPPPLAPPLREGEKSEKGTPIPRHSSFVIPSVPFVSQAPFRVWDLPYKEFCEEASVLTVHYWKQGQRTPPADQLDRDLKDIQAWEEANIGRWEDTTAEEVARILKEKFGYASTRVVRDVTVEDLKQELDAWRPVIVPAAGRELSSPYYRPPGPLYHMLVIIGYDDRTGEFITNDVGTNTKGAGFRFAYDDLYGAIGDWDAARGAPDTSQKVMIVVP